MSLPVEIETLLVAHDAALEGRDAVAAELRAMVEVEFEHRRSDTVWLSVTGTRAYTLNNADRPIGSRTRIVATAGIRSATVHLAHPAPSVRQTLTFNAVGQAATIETAEDGDRIIGVTRAGALPVVVGSLDLALRGAEYGRPAPIAVRLPHPPAGDDLVLDANGDLITAPERITLGDLT